MHTFELRNIDAVVGPQKFEKLVRDGVCLFDEFENNIEDCYKSEIAGIYAVMNEVANLRSVPRGKFHFYDKTKGANREFEFKSSHLRVYGITKPNGMLVIVGGTKAKQKKDENEFRKFKNEYLETL